MLYASVCSWLDDPFMPKLARSPCAKQIFNDCCAHFGMNCNVHKVVQQAIQNAQQRVTSATEWKHTDQLQGVKSAFELVRGEVLYALYQKCGLSSREAQECAQADYQIDKPLLEVAERRIASMKQNGKLWLKLPSESRRSYGQYCHTSLFAVVTALHLGPRSDQCVVIQGSAVHQHQLLATQQAAE